MDEGPDQKPKRDQPEPIVRTATEARQGEIILGKWGRRIWIGSFVLMVLLIVVLGLWQ
jgi:hypothetical protein